MIEVNKLDFEKLNGLIPAIIVDSNSEKVLMLGFMNKEALEKTLENKVVTFYSRTKGRLWTKGETSGDFLFLNEIFSDCDNDSLVLYVTPKGNTCHTGNYSCFNFRKDNIPFLRNLFDLIQERKVQMPQDSYTSKLFIQGENRIIQKVGEEAIETVIAAKNNDKQEILNETADLFFHLFVMLVDKGIDISEVIDILKERHKIKSTK